MKKNIKKVQHNIYAKGEDINELIKFIISSDGANTWIPLDKYKKVWAYTTVLYSLFNKTQQKNN